jgi:UDP-N-acetylmuramoyl-L-alanyl-D-glutamate--2,6-diaminopimelate ligase
MLNLLRKIVPQFLINWYHFVLSFLGAFFYGFPSRKLVVIGITGTNGKSTVVDLITRILEESGEKVCSLSSIRFKVGEKEQINDLKMTMPGRFKIQGFLKEAVDSGCHYAVLEVTSEGIKQHRHRFINFQTAIFTNLTPEHIESHGSFEKYREAKGKLFKATKKIHILNLDDENAKYFWQFPAELKIGYGINLNQELEVSEILKGENPTASEKGLEFKVENQNFRINLLGFFNIYNCLAAISITKSQKIPLEICKKVLEKVKGIPGRMEEVISEPFKVFVDYAFTPNALEKVYQTIRNNFKPKKLICVLGAAGGGRDKWKRPVLGELAGKYCDEIFITNEDPYDEDPLQILSQIKSGVISYKLPITNEILDRREAIKKSLKLAQPGDLIIITGKGCETSIAEKGKKIPWDDRKVVKEEFKRISE